MKLFWSLIAIIVLGAATYLAVGMLREGPATVEPERAPAPPAGAPTATSPSSPASEPAPPPPTETASTPPGPTPEVGNDAPADQSPAPQPVETPDPAPADAITAKAVEPSAPEPSPADSSVSRGDQTNLTADAAALSNPNPAPVDPPKAEPAAAPDIPAAEVKVEKREDGSLLIDGKYIVTGEGTKAKPYKLTWDLLVSVAHDYSPRDGKKFLPGRITMFDGAWVEMTGYIAFPIMSDQSDELLSMMNQWDGCCIGVPPTPYDAIEVRLTSPVSGPARFTSYGTVAGKLKVEPSLVGTWVVGLYVMDSATMTPKAIGGTNP